MPAAHGVQLLAPAADEKDPGLHEVGAVARFTQFDPAGHALQLVCCASSWYVPAAQTAQTV